MEKTFNGSHRNLFREKYFEWWYFHFVSTNGPSLNLIVHETDLFGIKHEPYISISILPKNKTPLHMHKRLLKNIIVPDTKYLALKDKSFIETPRKVTINVEVENVSLTVLIEKETKPLVINKGNLFTTKKGKSFWVVQVPHGKFNGVLKIGNSSYALKGNVYQDHQWGNLPVQNFVSDWIWGVLYDDDKSNIFFKILTQGGNIIDRFGIIEKTKIKKGTKIESTFLNNLLQTNNPEKINSKHESVAMGESEISFQIQRELLMRKRVNEELPGFKATYLRWLAKGGKARGIVEYLKIRNE